jgi:hypothetical protein
LVRWKRRPARRVKPWSPPDEQIWYAVLVESRRVDGKPRQKVIRHLAAIKAGQFGYPLSIARFWDQVDAALDELGIPDAERVAMESTIGAKVPRPDPDVLAQARRDFEKWKAGVSAMMQRLGRRRRRKPAQSGHGATALRFGTCGAPGGGVAREMPAPRRKAPDACGRLS